VNFVARLFGARRYWHHWFGARGERIAAHALRRKGFKILARNVRDGSGEIDLIARDGDTLVFVEVKTRQEGFPAEAVTPAKRRRITLTAERFMKRHGILGTSVRVRYDIVAVVWPEGRGKPRVEHIPHAFEAWGGGRMF